MVAEKIQKLISRNENEDVYAPMFFRIGNIEDKEALDKLLDARPQIKVLDTIRHQLQELVKTRKPSARLTSDEIEQDIETHLAGTPVTEYGVWVYYPWKDTLVHILDEKEFSGLRTNRNKYKITEEEQATLATKTIGIIGLSVGQSIALTMAMERICGHMRLADFDTADLSNLNRLRTGVSNIGLKKTVIAACEILEIDPFIDVKIFNDGITEANMDGFFTAGGKIDILVEVCDGLDVKILSRYKAKELGIPVVMDTNDRGMLDVERFDLEPGRPILHGLAAGLDPHNIKGLSNEDKVPYILKIVGADTLSSRMKASMLEVQQSISTWPQLASSVALGGALTTDVCRRILLGQFTDSGRYYVDFDELVKNKIPAGKAKNEFGVHPQELTLVQMKTVASRYVAPDKSHAIGENKLRQLLAAACAAPSGGNAQPWKFLCHEHKIFIFHDAFFSYSLLDFNNEGSYIGFGAMVENIEIMAPTLGLSVKTDIFPLKENQELIAVLSFLDKDVVPHTLNYLAPFLLTRVTNRNITEKKPIEQEYQNKLIQIAATVPGAKLQLFNTEEDIAGFADVLTRAERLRFLHPQGHYDTFVTELRFTKEEIESSADGLDVNTLNMSESEKAALQIARDASAVSFLHGLQKGEGFTKISRKSVLTASAMGVITMDGHDAIHFLQAGRALERAWLEATAHNISFQPITQIIFMIERCLSRGRLDFNDYEIGELEKINHKFKNLIGIENGRYPVFVFRLFYGDAPQVKSLRKDVNRVLFMD